MRMKTPFLPGDTKTYETLVTEEKLAHFETGLVHPVYSTFALGKDAEWACRLFVLEMKEAGEEGVGAALTVIHRSPATLGSQVRIEATLEAVVGNTIHCRYQAFCGQRLLAEGTQTQKIIDKARFDAHLQELRTSEP